MNNENVKKNSTGAGSRKSKYIKKTHNGQELTWSLEHGAWGVFRPYRKDPKTGELQWAKLHGKKAWFIPVHYGPLPEEE